MIDQNDPEIAARIWLLRKVVQRLKIVSHAPTQSYDVVMKGDDVPGTPQRWRLSQNRDPWPHLGAHSSKSGDTQAPRGGIVTFDDFQTNYRQKSHVYFQRKLDRLLADERATSTHLKDLLIEAMAALRDWRQTPPNDGAEPLVRGTYRWRCAIADFGGTPLRPGDIQEINRLFRMNGEPIGRSTIYRYRAQYRGARRRLVA